WLLGRLLLGRLLALLGQAGDEPTLGHVDRPFDHVDYSPAVGSDRGAAGVGLADRHQQRDLGRFLGRRLLGGGGRRVGAGNRVGVRSWVPRGVLSLLRA